MRNNKIDLAIQKYFTVKTFTESLNSLKIEDENSSKVNINQIFTMFYKNEGKILDANKLSFKYNLPKKKIKQNTIISAETTQKVISINSRVTKIPESFLALLDDLCLDRKDAEKFLRKSNEWAYVKSDRKIFCAAKGKT